MWISQLVGILYFAFRIYVNEFKTKNILKHERRYFSRFCAYYFGIAMILDWQLISLNAIITTSSISFFFISLFTDWPSIFNPTKQYPNFQRKEYFWMIMERLTLHIPLILVGLWMIITDFTRFVNESRGLLPFIIGASLFYGPFLLLDVRLRKKWQWPLGGYILLCSFAQVLAIVIIIIVL